MAKADAEALSANELYGPPWHRLEAALMTTSRGLRAAYDTRFACLDLNLTQATLLVYLHEAGPQRQTRLARRLGQGRPSTGATVDALELRGLVERLADPDDRRAWLVTLTAAGEELLGPITEIDRTLLAELRSGISHAERQQLVKLLLRIQENLGGILAEDGEDGEVPA